jgi:hypothetical protein
VSRPPGGEEWAAVLDAIERGLESFPPAVVALPALGPIPSALRSRARRALQRMGEVQATLERRREDVGRELVALTSARAAQARIAARGSGKPVPQFLDRRA